ncbi:MAG: tetratricopeptide repeat protein [Akkermansiaceae bacterium]
MASLKRAQHLRDLHRNEEAIAEIKILLADDPDNPDGHTELAITYLGMEKRKKDALESINTAISLEPEEPANLSIKAIILSAMDRDKEALEVATQAIALEPGPFQWYAKATAHAGLRQWSEAEIACNQSLEIDPDFDSVLNLKNSVLRMQGRLDEASQNTAVQLSRNAENPNALANAGWTNLQRKDFKKAEDLFRDALRSDPENEYARAGLVEAFKARSLFYRLYLSWTFFLQRLEGKSQWALIIGIYLAYRFGRAMLSQIHPALGVALVIVYLLFVFGSFIAPGIGNFLILRDPLARLTLDQREKWDGMAVGGLFFSGILFTCLGGLFDLTGLLFFGGACMVATVPAAMIFRNYERKGQLLFGGIAAFTLATGLLCLVNSLTVGDPTAGRADTMITFSMLGVFLSTWFTGMSSLVKRSPTD